jgi:hypothetical protein
LISLKAEKPQMRAFLESDGMHARKTPESTVSTMPIKRMIMNLVSALNFMVN